jgi:hypothetical protein
MSAFCSARRLPAERSRRSAQAEASRRAGGDAMGRTELAGTITAGTRIGRAGASRPLPADRTPPCVNGRAFGSPGGRPIGSRLSTREVASTGLRSSSARSYPRGGQSDPVMAQSPSRRSAVSAACLLGWRRVPVGVAVHHHHVSVVEQAIHRGAREQRVAEQRVPFLHVAI